MSTTLKHKGAVQAEPPSFITLALDRDVLCKQKPFYCRKIGIHW